MYIKAIENGYITAVGTGIVGEEITESEYDEILSVIRNKPKAEGKGYKLKTDLTWEAYDLPIPSEDDELDDAEALSIITGESE